jgi:hypothetical protein
MPTIAKFAILIRLFAATVVCALAFFTTRTCCADDSFHRIINASRSNISRIRTYDFQCTESNSSGKQRVYRVRQKNAKTRVDIMGDSDQAKPAWIFAYDGDRFQNYDRQSDTLSFTRHNRFPNQYAVVCPFMIPYSWVWDSPKCNWTDLKGNTLWLNVSAGAEHSEGDTGMLKFRVYNSMVDSATFDIYFDSTHNYFPRRICCVSGQTTHVVETEVIREVPQGNGDDLWYPENIRVTEEPGGSVTQYILSDVKVNHNIPDSVFTLSHSIARRIDDYDRNMERYRELGQLIEFNEPPKSRYGWPVVLAIAAVVVFFLARKVGWRFVR